MIGCRLSTTDSDFDITMRMPSFKQAFTLRCLLLLLILAGGAALRASYNANTLLIDPVRADAAYNLIYAHNLVDHAVFSKDRGASPVPDSYWAPGFPLFLAAIIKVAAFSSMGIYTLTLFCQLLLGVGTIYLCYLVSRSFLPGYWPLLPPLLVAISPHLVSTASYVLTETLFGFLLILSIYALGRAVADGRIGSWLAAGSCFALAYLVNPVSLFLAPLLAILLASRGQVSCGSQRKHFSLLVLLVAPVLIVVMMWSLRAAISVPADQPTASKRLLTNLAIGLYPDYHEKWRASILQPHDNIVVPGSGVDESYTTFIMELVRIVAQAPLKMLAWYAVDKPFLLWDWEIKTGFGDIYIYRVEYSLYHISGTALATYSLMHALHIWILVGALLGAVILLAEGKSASPVPALLYVTLIYISAVYVASQAEARYSIPLRAELYICFAYFLWRVSTWLGRLRDSQNTALAN